MNRLTVEMWSNPDMSGNQHRKLVMLDEEGRQVGLTVARIGRLTNEDAERVQASIDAVVRTARRDAIEESIKAIQLMGLDAFIDAEKDNFPA